MLSIKLSCYGESWKIRKKNSFLKFNYRKHFFSLFSENFHKINLFWKEQIFLIFLVFQSTSLISWKIIFAEMDLGRVGGVGGRTQNKHTASERSEGRMYRFPNSWKIRKIIFSINWKIYWKKIENFPRKFHWKIRKKKLRKKINTLHQY